MSLEFMASERVGYVHCNFCKTVLAVIVPYSSLYTIGTVRCGHCANLLSVNMESFLQVFPLQNSQQQQLSPGGSSTDSGGSSSKSINVAALGSQDHEPQPPRLAPIRPPEKRQRVPSAYNRFIKEEIQRIKAGNPEITHREAFSTAAKNWAHFPHIHFGSKTTMMEGNKQGKLDHSFPGEGMMNKKAKSNAFY